MWGTGGTGFRKVWAFCAQAAGLAQGPEAKCIKCGSMISIVGSFSGHKCVIKMFAEPPGYRNVTLVSRLVVVTSYTHWLTLCFDMQSGDNGGGGGVGATGAAAGAGSGTGDGASVGTTTTAGTTTGGTATTAGADGADDAEAAKTPARKV